jgi:predicted RNase H-like HicB family nuclease
LIQAPPTWCWWRAENSSLTDSYEEALKNIKEAAELWIEVLEEENQPIPIETLEEVKRAPITIGFYV